MQNYIIKLKNLTVLFLALIFSTCVLAESIKILIFDGSLLIPNHYVLNNEELDNHTFISVNNDDSSKSTGRITTGLINDITDFSEKSPFRIVKRDKICNLNILHFVNKQDTPLPGKVGYVLMHDEKEYIRVFDDNLNVWRHILNSYCDSVDIKYEAANQNKNLLQ
ncbi:MAG: hypothetical protein R8G33_02590 [Gammaproteobacteria bacterium]|nr:hypothetical protein [Gammaproteobacteria bacterium]